MILYIYIITHEIVQTSKECSDVVFILFLCLCTKTDFFLKKTMDFKPPFLWVPCFHICKNLTSMQQSQLGWDCPTCGTVRQTVPCWLVVWNIFPYIVNNDPN